MKIFSAILVALSVACACQAQPNPPPMRPPGVVPVPSVAPAVRDTANYLIHVEWKDAKGASNSLEVLTAEGSVQLDSLQKTSVKINNNDVPTTLKLNASLTVLGDDKGRLQMFLGRTVPYVTGSGPNGMSSYSQMSVGLQSTFIVKFGKPLVAQNDESGTITVLVNRLTD